MQEEIGERISETVSLIYKRGQLQFNFHGKMSYDSSLKDEEFTGWQFVGEHFTIILFNNKVVDITSEEKEYLCWSYNLVRNETPERFFMNLLNGLGGNSYVA